MGGDAVPLGGAKQRAVLAVLLLRAGEVVSVERLIDEVWGNTPRRRLRTASRPTSRVYGSSSTGMARSSCGVAPDTRSSSATPCSTHGSSRSCWMTFPMPSTHDNARVSKLAAVALALWRGPARRRGVGSSARAEAERLEELRLRALDQRLDAELALGRHEGLVGELQILVGQNPYRERFVGQLMLAIYRSGRHAGALDAYEKMRAALDDDLGLQPSAELQQLSGQIVRQEPVLQSSTVHVQQARRGAIERKARRVSGLVLAGAVTVAAMAFTANGSTPNEERASPTTKRVAIVLPGSDSEETLSHAARSVSAGVRRAQVLNDLETETLLVDEHADASAEIERLARRIDLGGFGIVIVLGDGKAARALSRHVRERPEVVCLHRRLAARPLPRERVERHRGALCG